MLFKHSFLLFALATATSAVALPVDARAGELTARAPLPDIDANRGLSRRRHGDEDEDGRRDREGDDDRRLGKRLKFLPPDIPLDKRIKGQVPQDKGPGKRLVNRIKTRPDKRIKNMVPQDKGPG